MQAGECPHHYPGPEDGGRFEYERAVGQANRAMDGRIETVFVLTSTEHTFVSSTIVRNIYLNGGDVTRFLPERLTTEDLRECEKGG